MEKTVFDYIKETPEIIKVNVGNSQKLTNKLVKQFLSKKYKTLLLIGSGSSYTSAMIAKYYIQERLEVEVKVVWPKTFAFYENKIEDDVLPIVISQSGYSTNTISAIEELIRQNKTTVAITSDLDSDIAHLADLAIDYGAGVEKAFPVTKGVTSVAVFLMLFALEAAMKLDLLDSKQASNDKSSIINIMNEYDTIISDTKIFFEKHIKTLTNMKKVHVAGWGPNYGTVLESAQLIPGAIHIPALPLELDELCHGTVMQLTPEYTVFIFDNGDYTQERTLELYKAATLVTDKAFLLSPKYKGNNSNAINIFDCKNKLISPLAFLPVMQLLVFYTQDYLNITKHPLVDKFSEVAMGKTDRYRNR